MVSLKILTVCAGIYSHYYMIFWWIVFMSIWLCYDVGKVCMNSIWEKGINVTASNIVLVGFMGTGKSTVGKQLAEHLGWIFQDSDAALEEEYQTSISFSRFGK
jgi:ATP-dependent protease Clp ATPase subunit